MGCVPKVIHHEGMGGGAVLFVAVAECSMRGIGIRKSAVCGEGWGGQGGRHEDDCDAGGGDFDE